MPSKKECIETIETLKEKLHAIAAILDDATCVCEEEEREEAQEEHQAVAD